MGKAQREKLTAVLKQCLLMIRLYEYHGIDKLSKDSHEYQEKWDVLIKMASETAYIFDDITLVKPIVLTTVGILERSENDSN